MNTRPIQTPGFTNLMSRGEIIAAVIYLPLHVVGIPLGLGYLSQVWPALAAMTDTEINLAYYGVGLVYMLVLLRGFLRRSFDAALDAKGNFFVGVAGGYAVDIGLSFILSSVLLVLSLDLGMAPNNEAILAGAAGSGTGGLAIALENLAPQYLEMGISAEVLHRIGCLSAIGLDSLPHNGAVVVLLTLAGMTHKESYKQIFVTTVVLTVIVAAIGIALATVMY